MSASKLKTPKFNLKRALADLHKQRSKEAKEAGITGVLHDAQIQMIKPLFDGSATTVFAACSRKFGKTESACYIAWRHVFETENAAVYFVGPEKEHLGQIYWTPQRIQKYLGEDSEKYIKRIDERAKLIEFHKGGFIQLMSSDNWKAGNGLTPSLIIYDEFKAFHPRFHTEMAPNRVARAAKLFVVGTMPRVGDRNKLGYESLLATLQDKPYARIFTFTTFDNPMNCTPEKRAIIDEEMEKLRQEGREDVVQCEYYSRIVPGGALAVFPMFKQDKHVKIHEFIMSRIRENIKQFDFYQIIDPAGSGVFGAIFAAIHRKTKHIFVLDEIYEKDAIKSATSNMIPLIRSKMLELAPHLKPQDWIKVCDEQATLYIAEIFANNPDLAYHPTQKHANAKENGIKTLCDAMLMDLFIISDRCPNLIKEIEDYARNDAGELQKNRHVMDHLLDCVRYLIAVAGYTTAAAVEAVKKYPENWDWIKRGFSAFGREDYNADDWDIKVKKSQFDTF